MMIQMYCVIFAFTAFVTAWRAGCWMIESSLHEHISENEHEYVLWRRILTTLPIGVIGCWLVWEGYRIGSRTLTSLVMFNEGMLWFLWLLIAVMFLVLLGRRCFVNYRSMKEVLMDSDELAPRTVPHENLP